MPFWSYAVGSLSYGIKVSLYVFLGTTLEKILAKKHTEASDFYILAAEILVSLILTVWIAYVAKRAIQRKLYLKSLTAAGMPNNHVELS